MSDVTPPTTSDGEQLDRGGRYRRVQIGVTRGSALIGALGVVLLMLATVVDVIRRFLGGGSLPGVVEYSEVILSISVYSGLAVAQLRDEHVSTTIFVGRLSRRWRVYSRTVGYLVVTPVLIWMTWVSVERARASIEIGESRFGLMSVPIWPARVAIPIGLTLLVVEIVTMLVLDLRSLRESHDQTSTELPDDRGQGDSDLKIRP